MIDKVIAYIDEKNKANVERLNDFLRIPSISTDPQKKAETRKAAEWVLRVFKDAGIKAEMIETKRHPAIFADSGPVEGAPTVLVYGHYDVQPTGDEGLWHSPPFEPTIRNGDIFARGSADDKGQVLTHMMAAEAWMKVAKKMPVRVKYLIEGEEEIGSPNLDEVITKNKEKLACDYVVLSDTPKFDKTTPAITYGTKGLIYKEILITGAKQNLHSGSYGGTLTNPGNALAVIIASLRDKDNRVTIPGFYDDVKPISDDERKRMSALPFDEKGYLASMGAPSLEGEKGYTTLERRGARPTLDVNGLGGGYMGEGASTVIPAKVFAKVSMRIVPDQNPEKISKAFEKAVMAAAPPGIKVEILDHSAAAAYVATMGTPGMNAATDALKLAWGKAPVFIREGGTLPILPLFKKVLGADSIMMGFCMPDCNAHGPNEFFAVDDFYKGTRAAAYFVDQLAKISHR